MNPLEQEILKYEKKEFKVEQKRTLKYGSRTSLCKKKGFGLIMGEAVYIYYVNGIATTDSFSECFKDYEKYYKEKEGNFNIKGFFLCSGSCNKKLFKNFSAMISKDKIRNSIKLVSLDQSSAKETEKEEEIEKEKPAKAVEREKPDNKDERKTVEISEVLTKIKNFPIHKRPKNEKDLDSMLVSYLCAFYPDIETQVSYQNSKIDAQIGNDVGIEFKYQPSIGEFDRLYGQIEKYLKHFEKIIVVIGYERTRELTDNFEKRMKERGWLNNKVYIVSLG